MTRLVVTVLTWMIRLYRPLGLALFGPCCRFHPTCSEYAEDALRLHGPVKGIWLSVKRLSKCHPFHEGGWDPVPFKEAHQASQADQAKQVRPAGHMEMSKV